MPNISEIAVYALGEYSRCKIYDLQVMQRDMHQALPPASLAPAALSEVLRDVASLDIL